MPDQAPIFKASQKETIKRLQNIRLENKWTLVKMHEKLNSNKEGFTVSLSGFKAIMLGKYDISRPLLLALCAIGYDPYWVLTGLGEKKLTKEASTMITDIHKFRVELATRTAKIEVLEANLNQAHRDIEYLKREFELMRSERKEHY
jgi:hypothetical protein